MDDERYYENPIRRDINFRHHFTLGDTQLTAEVRILTKAYRDFCGKTNAHIETFVLSSDPRVKSQQIVHRPFQVATAKRLHARLANNLRRALGLVVVDEANDREGWPGEKHGMLKPVAKKV